MKSLLVISLVWQVFVSCGGNNGERSDSTGSIRNDSSVMELKNNRTDEIDSMTVTLDSASLDIFWNNFKLNLRENNKKGIINVLEFPIHAYNIVLFQYSYDCDTATFIEQEKKFLNIDIDSSNINRYYNFIFSDVFKEIINQTTTEDILERGVIYESGEGIAYRFFAKDYNVDVKCVNDHELTFYFYSKNNSWRVRVGGN
jgi:hypothetical protein